MGTGLNVLVGSPPKVAGNADSRVMDYLPADSVVHPRFEGLLRMMSRAFGHGSLAGHAIQGTRAPQQGHLSLGQALAGVPGELDLCAPSRFQVIVVGRRKSLSAGVRDEVYQIGREAIVNACTHSSASDIEVEIEYGPAALRLMVRDNGCGIDPQGLQLQEQGRKGQSGLRAMLERAERIGGRCRIMSRSRLGTEIELTVPGLVAYGPGGEPDLPARNSGLEAQSCS